MSSPVQLGSELAITQATTHYENFPVANCFMPKSLRPAVAIIYAFARTADDIADEGQQPCHIRQQALSNLHDELTKPNSDLMHAVADTIRQYQLTTSYFHHLIAAFEQDLVQTSYRHHRERLAYCSLSANPVGRLMLELFRQQSPLTNRLSDAVCSALQILNFLQDISSDYNDRGRIYLLQQHLEQQHIPPRELLAAKHRQNLVNLINAEIDYCHNLLTQGRELLTHTHGRLKWQLATIMGCADTVIYQLKQRDSRLEQQARLNFRSLPRCLGRTLLHLWCP